jgi:hypothetical protein
MKKTLIWAPLLALGLVVSGCGGSSLNGIVNIKNPRIRAVNDFHDVTAVSADVDGTTLLTSQAFGATSAYSIVTNGNRTITFNNVSGATSIPLVSQTSLLQTDSFYTAIGAGSGGGGRHIILLTDGSVLASNMTKVRIVNVDEDQAAVDVYFTSTATGSLSGQTPQITNLAFASAPADYTNFTPGSYKVWVTPTGTQTVLTSQTVTLTANTIITLVFAKTSSSVTIQTLQDRPLPAGTP